MNKGLNMIKIILIDILIILYHLFYNNKNNLGVS